MSLNHNNPANCNMLFQVHGEETFICTKVLYIINPTFLTCSFSLPPPPYTNHLHSFSWTTVKCRPWGEEWVCQRTAPVTVMPLEGNNWKYLNRIWIAQFQCAKCRISAIVNFYCSFGMAEVGSVSFHLRDLFIQWAFTGASHVVSTGKITGVPKI